MRTPSRAVAAFALVVIGALLGPVPVTAAQGPTAEPQRLDDQADAPTAGVSGVGNVAHRGFSVAAPENTMNSVRQAIAEESDFQGIDVRRTKDGRLVVLHDATLARTTNVEEVFPGRSPWRVRNFTYQQIEQLDAGSWFDGSYTGERIPTLAKMLTELNQSPSGVFLEVKDPASYPGIGDQVVQALQTHTDWLDSADAGHRLVVQSFDENWLRDFHIDHPGIPVGALGAYLPSDLAWLDQINVHYTNLDPNEVAAAHAAGVQVSVFPVDERADMEAMLDEGVDAICTNRPRLLHDLLAERGLLLDRGGSGARLGSITSGDWRVATPASGLLETRVPVRVRLTDATGAPVRWSWVALQAFRSGAWATVQERATDLDGRVSTTFWLSRDVRLRWLPIADGTRDVGPAPAARIDAQRAPTAVSLSGPGTARADTDVQLDLSWKSLDGRAITGTAELWSHPSGADHWSRIRTGEVTDGKRSFTVHPGHTTEYQVRAARGSWWQAGTGQHRVVAQRLATSVSLGGPRTARAGTEVKLPVSWKSVDGRAITGRAELWSHPSGADHWTRIRTGEVTDGKRSFTVRPRRSTRYEVRAAQGWWWQAATDRHRVVVGG